MYTTIAIVIAIVVVAAAIIVGLKIWRGESEPVSNSDVPKDAKQVVERARAIQQQYWTLNPDEKKRLLEKGVDDLAWDQALRLLHLACLEMISDGSGREQLDSEELEPGDAPPGENRDLIVRLVRRLRSESSPYKPRHVAVWQGEAGESDKREPDLQGVFRNASLTHLGCIEVIRLDSKQQPAELTFIPLDEIRGAVFASPALFRPEKFFFDDGRPDEIVLVPLLYGISWLSPIDFDQDGTATRFICAIEIEEGQMALSVGVGHQDFVIEGERLALFGLGSIAEIMVTLLMDDPKFDQKCKARGLDPDEVRQSITKH
jgi:hypothetical protein